MCGVVRLKAEGYTYEAIGRKLAISPRTVDAQLQRARKALRKEKDGVE